MSQGNWHYSLYRSIWHGLDLIFPPTCGGCGKAGTRWCDECQVGVKTLDGLLCDICGIPVTDGGICESCRSEKPLYRALRSWAVFDDPLRTALHKLKYRRDISLGYTLADAMAGFVMNLNWPIDLIVPIPLGRRRYRERGYNQVGMIALPLALALNVRYEPSILVRCRETRSQVGLTRQERMVNVHAAFLSRKRADNLTVFLIDDVSTTGSTLSSAAEAFIASGAKDVYGMTVARALKIDHA